MGRRGFLKGLCAIAALAPISVYASRGTTLDSYCDIDSLSMVNNQEAKPIRQEAVPFTREEKSFSGMNTLPFLVTPHLRASLCYLSEELGHEEGYKFNFDPYSQGLLNQSVYTLLKRYNETDHQQERALILLDLWRKKRIDELCGDSALLDKEEEGLIRTRLGIQETEDIGRSLAGKFVDEARSRYDSLKDVDNNFDWDRVNRSFLPKQVEKRGAYINSENLEVNDPNQWFEAMRVVRSYEWGKGLGLSDYFFACLRGLDSLLAKNTSRDEGVFVFQPTEDILNLYSKTESGSMYGGRRPLCVFEIMTRLMEGVPVDEAKVRDSFGLTAGTPLLPGLSELLDSETLSWYWALQDSVKSKGGLCWRADLVDPAFVNSNEILLTGQNCEVEGYSEVLPNLENTWLDMLKTVKRIRKCLR